MHCSIWRLCVSLLIFWCLRKVIVSVSIRISTSFVVVRLLFELFRVPKVMGSPSNVVLNYFCGGNEDCSWIYMRLQDSRNLNPECSGLWQVDSSWQVDSWMCQYKWRIRMLRFSWMFNQKLFCFCNALMNWVAMWLKCCQEVTIFGGSKQWCGQCMHLAKISNVSSGRQFNFWFSYPPRVWANNVTILASKTNSLKMSIPIVELAALLWGCELSSLFLIAMNFVVLLSF
jgi:hypothetical protein